MMICLAAAALLVGVALGRAGIGYSWLAIAAVPAVAALRRPRYALVVVALAALAAVGIERGLADRHNAGVLTGLIGSKVQLTATVADDPAVSAKGVMSFTADHLKMNGQSIPGALPVYIYPIRVQRGFQLALTGTIKPGFGKYTASLSYPGYQVISSHQSWLERLRERFFAGVHTALPEPDSSFALGLLVGIRALIPKDMQATLALVGLSHLVAVSGYNLTIIVKATERILGRFGRGIALVGSLWLIAAFLSVTGASASVVRAAVISILVLLAGFYGRKFQPMVLILIAAAGTALVKPSYLSDLGWLLSFLAFYGVLVLAPAVQARLGSPKSVVVNLLIESLCAQLLTLPLILYAFGQLSIVSPFTNLIILPMVPLAMLVCFVAGLAGMLAPAFCGWLAWPAQLLLNLMLKIINAFAALPWAGRTAYFDLPSMLASYALIGLITLVVLRTNRRKSSTQLPGQPLRQSIMSY